jgi:uncharacterized protein YneF (UPF0154 family)
VNVTRKEEPVKLNGSRLMIVLVLLQIVISVGTILGTYVSMKGDIQVLKSQIVGYEKRMDRIEEMYFKGGGRENP